MIIPTDTSAQKPMGSPFIIDQCPFHYGERIHLGVADIAEDKVYNWPMVYILANDSTAYIGQTTSVATRVNQHSANVERKDFTTISIIFNEEFNASVITDYEHRLIGLMHGDEKYRLTNKNEGMTDTNYFSKEEYSLMFEQLWEQLRDMELADHSIVEIEESEVFKYSPYKGLTIDQRVALDRIFDAITTGVDGSIPIVVEGMPGTGKTVLAIYLLKMLKDKPEFADFNIRLLEPVTSLRNTLRQSLRGVSGLNESDVIGPADLAKPQFGYIEGRKKNFDIVLVDEAHRLKQRINLGTQYGNYDKVNGKLGLPKEATQIDWVMDQVKLPIFFYDPLQAIGPSCVSRESIQNTLGLAVAAPITLESQMRVKGGKEYLTYIENILNCRQKQRCSFEGYEFVLHEDFADFSKCFDECISDHSLSRMIAGYAWKWRSKGDKTGSVFDIEFDGVSKRWNCTYDNWVGRGANNASIAHEVGCIHSIQGYDLSYAYVIIGNDLVLDQDTGLLEANKECYFDTNGKNTATQEELTRYIKNIYYVLLTRGIYGTHVYVADPVLRDYFRRFASLPQSER